MHTGSRPAVRQWNGLPVNWRVVITDTESESGVAPTCSGHESMSVEDCCPHPHLECWTPLQAKIIRDLLNAFEVGICE